MAEHTSVDDDGKREAQRLQLPDRPDTDSTPTSEVPIALNIRTPGGTEEVTQVSLSTTANDYFAPTPTVIDHQPGVVTAPAAPQSDPVTDKYASLPDSQPPADAPFPATVPARPPPQTSVSSTSVETSTSTATTVPLTSATAALSSIPSRPAFPNQSYAALHHQQYTRSYLPSSLRQSGVHSSHINTFASAIASLHQSGARSAITSPASTPSAGLFQTHGPPSAPATESPASPATYASPFLHFTQQTMPKETHVADVDVDPISGRKLINDYEIIDELGRGTHGKVKLGRDLNKVAPHQFVAIKIVERFSKRRKLGKLGTTEDKVKKEVAILKKARHPNVVALLEVIDDPSRKKVYIVLEWIERGQIHWRAKAPREVAVLEMRRYNRERANARDAQFEEEEEEGAVLIEAKKRLDKLKRARLRVYRRMKAGTRDLPEAWSNELAGDDESGDSEDDRRSRISSTTAGESSFERLPALGSNRPDQSHSPAHQPISGTGSSQSLSLTGLEGTMYGAYDSNLNLAGSMAGSRSGGRRPSAPEALDSYLDSDLEYVPVMTIQQIRVAFRDTLLGLQYLHYQGIVHRDIKPPNLLATIDNRVKISDFGVSYLGRPVHDEDGEDISEHEARDLDDEAKELAKTVGTPAFYAPELCITELADDPLPVTKAIDVWALGITLFCMLFARTPFVDNEFVVMRQIAEEDIYLPRKRLQPVDSQAKSRSSSHPRNYSPAPTERRDEFDFAYEEIDDELHDLMTRLLIKDPRKRITLEEVRHHPWVLADLPDQASWLEETNITRQSHGRKIEVSKEELNTAVVPLQLIDRVKSGVKRLGESIWLLKSTKSSRPQSQSGPSNAPVGPLVPPTGPVTSAIAQDARRANSRTELASSVAIQIPKHGEHPLSQASAPGSDPGDSEGTSHRSRFWSPASEVSVDEATALAKSNPSEASTTIMSTTESGRTVRQSDFNHPTQAERSPHRSPELPGTATTLPSPGGSNLGSLLGSATRHIMKTVRERSASRTASDRSSPIDNPAAGHADPHAEPSLAISQTSVTGEVHTPEASTDVPSNFRPRKMPPSARPRSMTDHILTHTTGPISRMSSGSSIASDGRFVAAHMGEFNRSPGRPRSRMAPESSAEDWQSAQDERVRKLVRESQDEADKAATGDRSPASAFDSPRSSAELNCPPSPDDDQIASRDDSRAPSSLDMSNHETSAETSPTGHNAQLPAAMVSSSSDLGSAASTSMSHPSMPSVISEASSMDKLATPMHRPADPSETHEFSDDTLNQESPIAISNQGSIDQDDFTPGPDDTALNSDSDGEDDWSDGSDCGVVMSRARPNGGARDGNLNARRNSQQAKSSRSDSNNTMKNVRSIEENGRERHISAVPGAGHREA